MRWVRVAEARAADEVPVLVGYIEPRTPTSSGGSSGGGDGDSGDETVSTAPLSAGDSEGDVADAVTGSPQVAVDGDADTAVLSLEAAIRIGGLGVRKGGRGPDGCADAAEEASSGEAVRIIPTSSRGLAAVAAHADGGAREYGCPVVAHLGLQLAVAGSRMTDDGSATRICSRQAGAGLDACDGGSIDGYSPYRPEGGPMEAAPPSPQVTHAQFVRRWRCASDIQRAWRVWTLEASDESGRRRNCDWWRWTTTVGRSIQLMDAGYSLVARRYLLQVPVDVHIWVRMTHAARTIQGAWRYYFEEFLDGYDGY